LKLRGENVIFHPAQLMHYLNFSDDFFCSVMAFKNFWNKFDGHDLTSCLVFGLDYLAKGTFPDIIDDSVLRLDEFPDAG
jgi:hypothetical protein